MISPGEERLIKPYFTGCEASDITVEQMESISAQTRICLRKVEWFAVKNGIVPQRYLLNLGTFSCEGQLKLLESTVVIVGLGGLGGQLVEQLGRAGVGKIIAVDPDIFEETNLNRQLLSDTTNLGRDKTNEVKERLEKINNVLTSCRVMFGRRPIWSLTAWIILTTGWFWHKNARHQIAPWCTVPLRDGMVKLVSFGPAAKCFRNIIRASMRDWKKNSEHHLLPLRQRQV